MEDSQELAADAARLFAEHDRLKAEIRVVEDGLRAAASAYARAVGLWGFTVLMLRQACEARGLIRKEAA